MSDTEQKILSCWGIISDIDVVLSSILEDDVDLDTASNMLLGIKLLYDIKFDKLFKTYEQSLTCVPKRVC
jgi:hypothetical protein